MPSLLDLDAVDQTSAQKLEHSYDKGLCYMARIYLGMYAAAALVEHLFLNVQHICTNTRCSLKPTTIEQLVSSSQWLKGGEHWDVVGHLVLPALCEKAKKNRRDICNPYSFRHPITDHSITITFHFWSASAHLPTISFHY